MYTSECASDSSFWKPPIVVDYQFEEPCDEEKMNDSNAGIRKVYGYGGMSWWEVPITTIA
jgi:hypothetical protein